MDQEEQVDKLISVYSEQNKVANKRWAFCTTLALITLSFNPDNPTQELFGATFSSVQFFLVISLAMAFTNIAFVVAHILSLRIANIFNDYLDQIEYQDKVFCESFTYKDLANSSVYSTYSRLWPIVAWIENVNVRLVLYRITKTVGDSIYLLITPATLLFIATPQIDKGALLGITVISISYLSILPSFVVWLQSIHFVWSRTH